MVNTHASVVVTPTDDGFKSFTTNLCGLAPGQTGVELLETYTNRLRECLDTTTCSDTAHFTVALAESFLETCRALHGPGLDDQRLRAALKRLEDIRPNGPRLTDRWQRQGFLDVHSKTSL